MPAKRIIVILVAILAVLAGLYLFLPKSSSTPPQTNSPANSPAAEAPAAPANQPEPVKPAPAPDVAAKQLSVPMDRAKERVSKKPFGIYITPKTSPVQPEKFSGYHTGVDFETFAEEQSTDVPVKVVCAGKLLAKRTATGYGGVLVQSCSLDGQPVTIVYGHMRLSSVGHNVGDDIAVGETLGVLGTGYSAETSEERKHLHLGVHKGAAVNITGYVSSQAALGDWLNALDYM
jgi:peptidase M23-like protein